eukprot:gene15353-biopygen4248
MMVENSLKFTETHRKPSISIVIHQRFIENSSNTEKSSKMVFLTLLGHEVKLIEEYDITQKERPSGSENVHLVFNISSAQREVGSA